MKKIWFFVEGDSENYFVSNLIRKKYYDTIIIEGDMSKFISENINDSTHSIIYCFNCNGVDSIPYDINDWYHAIQNSGANDIFIVCDVERKLKCPPNRRKFIEHRLDTQIVKNKIKYICFNPSIESLYWECTRIIKQIIELEYKRKYSKSQVPLISIPDSHPRPLNDLKYLFKKFKLKYPKARFAEEFFPRVDYNRCTNTVLNRTIELIQSTLDK